MRIRGWRVKTQDRQDWRRVIREAKVHTGLQRYTDDDDNDDDDYVSNFSVDVQILTFFSFFSIPEKRTVRKCVTADLFKILPYLLP